jgi:hypothetical protein
MEEVTIHVKRMSPIRVFAIACHGGKSRLKMNAVIYVQSKVRGISDKPENPPNSWFITTLFGRIQVTKAKALSDCQMNPGNQYQTKEPAQT